MALNAVSALFASAFSKLALRDLWLARNGHVLQSAAEITTTTMAPIPLVHLNGLPYRYDPTDLTSAHDGVAVLVSADSRRYKLANDAPRGFVVEGIAATPPVSPALGDLWIVDTAPTGAWVANADDIAVYTANGWRFIAAENLIGALVLSREDDTTYQLTDAGWRPGLGTASNSDGSLRARHFGGGLIPRFAVENQTTNTPPASPADGVSYIVGPSPTGAWAGQQTRIAVREDGAWRFYVQATGWRVYDKALAADVQWTGTAWVNPLSNGQTIPRLASAYRATGEVLTVVGSNGSSSSVQYTYSDGTAPTTSQRRVTFTSLELTLAATAASKKLLFRWDNIPVAALSDTAVDPVFAVFRDAETTAALWVRASIIRDATPAVIGGVSAGSGVLLSSDGASHTYRLAVMTPVNSGISYTLPKNALFTVQEFSA